MKSKVRRIDDSAIDPVELKVQVRSIDEDVSEPSKEVDSQVTDSVTLDKKPKVSTVADSIWNDIKNKKIEIFALPNQIVSQYCRQVTIEPTKCYVEITATSVLPALEAAVGSTYSVDYFDKKIISVSKK